MTDSDVTAEDLEEWINDTRSKQGIVRFDRDGHEDIEWIPGGRVFLISAAERKKNQRKVAMAAYDNFTNGTFRLLGGLKESDPDYDKLVTHPDAMDDATIEALLDGSYVDFETAILEVTSETTLRRVLDAAEEQGAAAKRLNLVRDRLTGLDRRSPMKGDTVSDGDPELERTAPQMAPGEDDGQPGPRRYEIDTELAG